MNIDLLKFQLKWRDVLSSIREIFKDLEQQGYNPNNMKPWKAHWDRQLYKALEHQYQLGLECLNENLPEIKVELTFR